VYTCLWERHFLYCIVSLPTFQVTSGDSSGDVLIAPDGLGDVAAIQLDGVVECYIKPNMFLAASPSLTLTTGCHPFRLSNTWMYIRVAGKGSVALKAYGGICRLNLQEGEHYVLNSKYVIAFDVNIKFKSMSDIESVTNYSNRWVNAFYRIGQSIMNRFRPNKNMYIAEGPGQLYFSSRIEPTWSGMKTSLTSTLRDRFIVKKDNPNVQEQSIPKMLATASKDSMNFITSSIAEKLQKGQPAKLWNQRVDQLKSWIREAKN